MGDLFDEFIEEKIVKSQSFLTLLELHEEYETWLGEKYGRLAVMIEFEKRFGEPGRNDENQIGWYGYRYIDDDIDDMED
jgi:hypothetical protein